MGQLEGKVAFITARHQERRAVPRVDAARHVTGHTLPVDAGFMV